MNSGKQIRRMGIALAMLATAPLAHGEKFAAQQQVLWQGDFNGPIMWGGPGGFIADPGDGNPQVTNGFTVAAGGTAIQDTPAGEALRFMDAGDWLKAIRSIESLDHDDPQLVTDRNGILRPLASLKTSLIASMPAEGKRAFRNLNDPAAKSKLKLARAMTDLAKQERAYLELVNSYALCSASADAADALGDLRFEQGRFNEAAALYRFSAEHTAMPADDPMQMAKRLIALSRAELWHDYDQLAQYAAFRHPDTPVTLGGSELPIKDLLAQLAEARDMGQPDLPTTEIATLAIPEMDRPEFEITLIQEDALQRLEQSASNNGMAGLLRKTLAPVVTADNDRLFTLSLGSVARIDPQTGTELWRQGETEQHTTAIHNRMHQVRQGYHQALIIADNTLLSVVPEGNYPNRARLIARDAETGEKQWDTAKLGNQGIVGEPIVIGDLIYAVTQKLNNPQLELVTLSLGSGKKIATLKLGTAANDPNMGAPVEMSPRLTMGQSYLFVQTNNGSLIAVDPAGLTIAWAFSQQIRQSSLGMHRRRGNAMPSNIALNVGQVAADDGMVFAKDTRSNKVHAFREYDAAFAWSARTDDDATIVHVDARHVYVMGEQLVAHDRRTGEPVWWTPHAGKKSGRPVFTQDACLIAGNNRFCRIELSTGLLKDFSEQVNVRADLTIVGNQLIRATPDEISGYLLPDVRSAVSTPSR